MKYSYYPGCTLKNKAKALDAYARACARVLGFELEEIENESKSARFFRTVFARITRISPIMYILTTLFILKYIFL